MNNETKYLLIAGVVLVGGFFLLKNNPNLSSKKPITLPSGAINSGSSRLDTNSLIRDVSIDSSIPDFQNTIGYKDAQGHKVMLIESTDMSGNVTDEHYEAYLTNGIAFYDKDGNPLNP